MKKRLFLILCILSIMLCIVFLYAAFTVKIKGFYDFSSMAEIILLSGAVLSGISVIASFYMAHKA